MRSFANQYYLNMIWGYVPRVNLKFIPLQSDEECGQLTVVCKGGDTGRWVELGRSQDEAPMTEHWWYPPTWYSEPAWKSADIPAADPWPCTPKLWGKINFMKLSSLRHFLIVMREQTNTKAYRILIRSVWTEKFPCKWRKVKPKS